MSIIIIDPNTPADSDESRYYVASQHIKAYPCGSRTYFDPESRLNTEYNIRRSAALNGFKNSYVQSIHVKEKKLIDIKFFVNGYYFEINDLPVADLSVFEKENNNKTLYAKVSLADRVLYSLFMAQVPDMPNNPSNDKTISYDTAVLTNQVQVETPQLDIIEYLTNQGSSNKFDTYVFTGLSLSTVIGKSSSTEQSGNNNIVLSHFYLPILQYNNGTWEVPQTSLLPLIDHGETENSIKVFGDIEAAGKSFFNGKGKEKDFSAIDFDNIKLSGNNIELEGKIAFGEGSEINLQGDVTVNGHVPTHCCLEQLTDDTNTYRLTFTTLTAGNSHKCYTPTNTETEET